MTRKISLIVILILLIVLCYELLFGTQEIIREKVAGINELKVESRDLNDSYAKLEKTSSIDFQEKQKKLATEIENYKKSKAEYENLIDGLQTQTTIVEEPEIKDIYDVDFLWTIIGNYATEEGINLKFDIVRNTTSTSSMTNTSDEYVVCDLKFVLSGNYVKLTDFIYDLEDDDRLNFEINDFQMQKSGDLQVTLNVKEVKVASKDLITSSSGSIMSTSATQTQNINSSTISETNDTDTINSNTIDTTNTVSSNTTNTQTIDNVN